MALTGCWEAGARAAERPRAIYRGKMSADVAEYLDSVHPLPGYTQGYNLTLHSPVQAEFDRQQDLGDNFYTPFSRRVTTRLAEGLRQTIRALESAVASDTLEPFRQPVASGVSANLYESVAELAKNGEGIRVELNWAAVRPFNGPESRFKFSSDSADILLEAAKVFRRRETSYGEQVAGLILRFDKAPPEFDGKATIAAMWDGNMTQMDVEFERTEYGIVIEAFRDKREVSLDADVHPSGNGYELKNPRNLTVSAQA